MSSDTYAEVEVATIGGALKICRVIHGLWQRVEESDKNSDVGTAVQVMENMVHRGFSTFDMADHYGDAELVVGQHNREFETAEKVALTKWCPPENGIRTLENATAAVDLALKRMHQNTIHLLQYHAWDYSDETYLHNLEHLAKLQKSGKIKLLGLTNVDTAHLELLLDSGFKIATNQICVNVIDQRVTRGRMQQVCLDRDVGILAYGTLLGGFLTESWLGKPEPASFGQLDASKRKYLRFIHAVGGWKPFQAVLETLARIAQKHKVTIAAIATRYVLDIPSVKAVIVGCRLSDHNASYLDANAEAFRVRLDTEDRAMISEAQKGLKDVPGDCGDEYRRPPFLTAAGDTSDHLVKFDHNQPLMDAVASGKRVEYSSGSKWEPIAGYCRAVRTGNMIRVSGTTANSPLGRLAVIGGTSARSQTVHILDIIGNALKQVGSSLRDVVRTRIFVRDAATCEEVSRAHGWVFLNAGVRPCNTFVTAGLIGDEVMVEIEVEAELGSADNGVFRI